MVEWFYKYNGWQKTPRSRNIKIAGKINWKGLVYHASLVSQDGYFMYCPANWMHIFIYMCLDWHIRLLSNDCYDIENWSTLYVTQAGFG